MNINGRRQEIINILQKRNYATVDEFSKTLGVSAVTIRTDLAALESDGFLIRTHGGAMKNEKKGEIRLISKTMSEYESEKKAIAKRASSLLSNGSTIILDSGSTVIHLLDYIVDKDITVVTNNVLAIERLKNEESVRLVTLGGDLRRASMGTVGPIACNSIKSINVDVYFMGAAAYTKDIISSSDMLEADLKKNMQRSADKIVFLADSSKFGKKALSTICSWNSIDTFVTDTIDAGFRRELEEMGVEVLSADD